MRIVRSSDRRTLDALAARDHSRDAAVERQAARIVADVRARGDRALREWTRTLDRRGSRARISLAPLSAAELRRGWEATPPDVRQALELAAANIARVAEKQVPRPFVVNIGPGHRIEQRVQPLARVGCYVPGGRYPLPSTLLMTAVPARAAGVKAIVAVCPSPAPVVLAAALVAGVTELYAIGGAQAIGALAYGTETIDRVDKIVGPGNAWVAAAKALVSRDCPIDLHAGPSEIVVCSDTGNATWIAADLIAQAEHDPAARAILVTTKTPLARAVAQAVAAQMPATGPAAAAIAAGGAIIVARSRREAIDIVNRLAPEHLVIDASDDARRYQTAGTIFVGEYSVQAAGDYCTGSNHVLPTGGAGRFRGGLSASDFVRVFSVQTLSAAAMRRLGPAAATLADAEGLTAHAASIRLRL
ncbi:MAG: histidinol dehydrogenase [Acidobacteria bacterium SCN 69-37]|nr:MAG: histidinol dehydrogenase [Acidobacteria bacterium SCN 69-37]